MNAALNLEEGLVVVLLLLLLLREWVESRVLRSHACCLWSHARLLHGHSVRLVEGRSGRDTCVCQCVSGHSIAQ